MSSGDIFINEGCNHFYQPFGLLCPKVGGRVSVSKALPMANTIVHQRRYKITDNSLMELRSASVSLHGMEDVSWETFERSCVETNRSAKI